MGPSQPKAAWSTADARDSIDEADTLTGFLGLASPWAFGIMTDE